MSAFPETPFDLIDRIELDAVPLAVVRHEGITIADLRDVFDAGYSALGSLFASGALVPAGPAVAVYHGDPMRVFDLELGFPVVLAPEQPTPVNGLEVTASALPAGPAAATTVLGAGWMGLSDRARAEGLDPRGIWIEVYVSDPSTATDALRTDLILPVA